MSPMRVAVFPSVFAQSYRFAIVVLLQSEDVKLRKSREAHIHACLHTYFYIYSCVHTYTNIRHCIQLSRMRGLREEYNGFWIG